MAWTAPASGNVKTTFGVKPTRERTASPVMRKANKLHRAGIISDK